MSRKRSSEFLSAMGVGWEIWFAIVKAVLAVDKDKADEHLRSLKDDKVRLKAVAVAIVGRAVEPAAAVETVTVPDLPAAALVAVVKEDVGLTYLNGSYLTWDFVLAERGKTFEVATWAPGREVSSEEVGQHFATLGGNRPFRGNTAAFLQWIGTRQDGWFVTIPSADRLFRGALGSLCAPYFGRGGAFRDLDLGRVAGVWYAGRVFVAFRECL